MFTGMLYNKIKEYIIQKKFNTAKRKLNDFEPSLCDVQIDKTVRNKIYSAYCEYTHQISSENMAISFDLSILTVKLLLKYSPENILDFGSGFSTFLFSFYKKNIRPNCNIDTIDDNELWLKKTCKFLEQYNLNGVNLYLFSNKKIHNQYDIILFDFNYVEERIKYINECIQHLKPGGIIIIDDVHKFNYGLEVINIFKQYPQIQLFNAENLTKDKFGRFSFIGINTRKNGY